MCNKTKHIKTIENIGGRTMVLEFEIICTHFKKDTEIYNSIKKFEFAAESTKTTLQNFERITKISDID